MLPDGIVVYYIVMLIRSMLSNQNVHGGRMLLSSAIALAQEACCFDYESHGAAAASSDHETLRRQWNQLICVFIYLADEHLAIRLGLGPLLPERPSEAVRSRFPTTFASLLPDSAVWEIYYDLCTETQGPDPATDA